ncbi:hypothetical protein HDU76_000868, partial [Blyttiomyces sp. JEL0837]
MGNKSSRPDRTQTTTTTTSSSGPTASSSSSLSLSTSSLNPPSCSSRDPPPLAEGGVDGSHRHEISNNSKGSVGEGLVQPHSPVALHVGISKSKTVVRSNVNDPQNLMVSNAITNPVTDNRNLMASASIGDEVSYFSSINGQPSSSHKVVQHQQQQHHHPSTTTTTTIESASASIPPPTNSISSSQPIASPKSSFFLSLSLKKETHSPIPHTQRKSTSKLSSPPPSTTSSSRSGSNTPLPGQTLIHQQKVLDDATVTPPSSTSATPSGVGSPPSQPRTAGFKMQVPLTIGSLNSGDDNKEIVGSSELQRNSESCNTNVNPDDEGGLASDSTALGLHQDSVMETALPEPTSVQFNVARQESLELSGPSVFTTMDMAGVMEQVLIASGGEGSSTSASQVLTKDNNHEMRVDDAVSMKGVEPIAFESISVNNVESVSSMDISSMGTTRETVTTVDAVEEEKMTGVVNDADMDIDDDNDVDRGLTMAVEHTGASFVDQDVHQLAVEVVNVTPDEIQNQVVESVREVNLGMENDGVVSPSSMDAAGMLAVASSSERATVGSANGEDIVMEDDNDENWITDDDNDIPAREGQNKPVRIATDDDEDEMPGLESGSESGVLQSDGGDGIPDLEESESEYNALAVPVNEQRIAMGIYEEESDHDSMPSLEGSDSDIPPVGQRPIAYPTRRRSSTPTPAPVFTASQGATAASSSGGFAVARVGSDDDDDMPGLTSASDSSVERRRPRKSRAENGRAGAVSRSGPSSTRAGPSTSSATARNTVSGTGVVPPTATGGNNSNTDDSLPALASGSDLDIARRTAARTQRPSTRPRPSAQQQRSNVARNTRDSDDEMPPLLSASESDGDYSARRQNNQDDGDTSDNMPGLASGSESETMNPLAHRRQQRNRQTGSSQRNARRGNQMARSESIDSLPSLVSSSDSDVEAANARRAAREARTRGSGASGGVGRGGQNGVARSTGIADSAATAFNEMVEMVHGLADESDDDDDGYEDEDEDDEDVGGDMDEEELERQTADMLRE